MAKQSGKFGSILVGATTVNVNEWTGNFSNRTIETNETNSDGTVSRVVGLDDATGSLKAFWDTAAHPTDSPPDLKNGSSVTLKLYLGDPTDGKFFEFVALVSDLEVRSGVESAIEYTCNFQLASGAITYPV